MKGKYRKRSDLVLKIIILILVCIMAFSLYKIVTIVYEYYVGTKEYDRVQEIAGTEGVEFAGDVDFEPLLRECKDVKAWLYSRDTVINYPVVQGNDNSYYLYRMINGEWNGKGSLFIDYRCNNPFKDFNTVIYGHRMKDGSMFHSLIDYRKNDYLDKHRFMILTTPEKKYNIYIFGVVTIPADSDKYKFNFENNRAEKQAYLDWIEENTETKTNVDVSPDDRIVMMSTCTYEFDNARLVVYGKLVGAEEDEQVSE